MKECFKQVFGNGGWLEFVGLAVLTAEVYAIFWIVWLVN